MPIEYFSSKTFFETIQYPQIPESLDLTIVGWNLKTPENIGSLIRTAANIGLKSVVLANDIDDPKRFSKINRIARSASNFVNIINIQPEDINKVIPLDYKWIALETSPGSENLFNTQLPDKMALFLGNEITGLPSQIVEKAAKSIHVPMSGPIKSMNVASSAVVAAFEWYRQKLHP